MRRYSQYMYSYPHKTAYRELNGIPLKDYVKRLLNQENGVYLHLPFCETKCGYCNLFSVTGQSKERIKEYLMGVERQINQYSELLAPIHPCFQEITIGGGTPLLLSIQQLERIISLIKLGLFAQRSPGLVIETAPNQTDKEKLEFLKEAGTVRVSMGVQSFWEDELITLHRHHSVKQVVKSLTTLMDMGFPSVNIDLIYGVPGQTLESFLESVKQATQFGSQELFLYPLYVKHGVIMEQETKEGMVLDENLAYRQYEQAREYLLSNGYRQDSMRRFVKGDSKSREFQDCGFGNTLSLGCGGRSYLGNLHFCTPYTVGQASCLKQLSEYIHTEDYTVIHHGFWLNEEEMRRRYVIKHLLIHPGIFLEEYDNQFGSQLLCDFPILNQWCLEGFLHITEESVFLTEKGMGFSDCLGPQLISEQVQNKMLEWESWYRM